MPSNYPGSTDRPAALRFVPLGGLGEIGMNCFALCQSAERGGVLVVDCGTTFPQGEYGVDVIHPDFAWLISQKDQLAGVFLTHGHEDHIGALPYLLRLLPIPVWGPPHALRLLSRRLIEHGFEIETLDLREVRAGDRVQAGSFQVEPIRVSHSIVEATALAIRTCAGLIVHSGDFKFDPSPPDGEPTDEERLLELADEGVELLLSDSTNVDRTTHSGSEADVAVALEELIARAPARALVALFSSNVQRLISLGKIAQRKGRRICLLGRSLNMHVEIARELGYLRWPEALLLPTERVKTFPPKEILVLASGTQAEPGSAMVRIAQSAHRFVEIQADDTVIFSSRIIPGNERAVVGLMSDLQRMGARVESPFTVPGVHTSGHASRGEQQQLIELLNPKAFVPVHGTFHHMRRHAELARSCGVPQVSVVENGQGLVLRHGKLSRGEKVRSGRVHVELGGEEISEARLRERREMGRGGLISVSLVTDRAGQLGVRPSVCAFGLPRFSADSEGLQMLTDLINERFESLSAADEAGTVEAMKRVIRYWTDERYGLRPVLAVHLTRMRNEKASGGL